MLTQLTLTALPGIPLVEPGDDLAALLVQGVQRAGLTLLDGDVLVVAQKIVSKAEGRLVNLEAITPSEAAVELGQKAQKDPRLVEVILGESKKVLRTRSGLVIVEHRLGFVCANAGVDHSNVRGPRGAAGEWVLMLPTDPDRSARELADRLQSETRSSIGVLIIDSHGRAWRMGTVGIAIGVAEFPALLDLRGHPDLFGDLLQVTQVGLADELAAGASLVMGQADEGLPVIHVRGLPYPLHEGSMRDLLRVEEDDLFR